MQTGNPWKLKVLGCIEGSLGDEKRIHAFLKPMRMNGEWFDLSKGLSVPVETFLELFSIVSKGIDKRVLMEALSVFIPAVVGIEKAVVVLLMSAFCLMVEHKSLAPEWEAMVNRQSTALQDMFDLMKESETLLERSHLKACFWFNAFSAVSTESEVELMGEKLETFLESVLPQQEVPLPDPLPTPVNPLPE